MFTGRITSTIITPCDMWVAKQNNILCHHPGQDNRYPDGNNMLSCADFTCASKEVNPPRFIHSQSQDIRIQSLHRGGTSNLTVSVLVSLLLCKFQRVQASILREEWVISGTQAPSGPGSWEGQVRAGKRRDDGSHHCLCIDFAPPGVLITSHPWYQPIFECKPWYMGKSWVDWNVRYDIRWQMSNLWNLLSSISINFTKLWGKGKEISEEARVI